MDKYAALRPERKNPSPNTCCHTRKGLPKQRWESKQKALSFLQSRIDTGGRGDWLLQEPYPCKVLPGTWHLRKKRQPRG